MPLHEVAGKKAARLSSGELSLSVGPPPAAMGVQRALHARGRWLRGSGQKSRKERQEDIIDKRELRENTTLQGSDAQNWGERGERVG